MNYTHTNFNKRVIITFVFLLLGLFLVFIKSVHLQIFQHEELSKIAHKEYFKNIHLPSNRGYIYDRNNKPLAISIDVPSVYANPMMIQDKKEIAKKIAPILNIKSEKIHRLLAKKKLFVWLKRHVKPDDIEKLKQLNLAGISITKESKRFYPNKKTAAHILGFTDIDSRGLEGIEYTFDKILTSSPKIIPALKDAKGNKVLDKAHNLKDKSDGADIILTIDLQIQYSVEKALREMVNQSQAKSGTAVVLNINSEILAMAVEPHFNPNKAFQSKPKNRRNRALTDMFEPGSTIKPFTIAAALDTGSVQLQDKIFGEKGSYQIGINTIRDRKPFKWLTLKEILQKSSNIGITKIAEKLGKKKLFKYLESLGFGKRTNINFPGENKGRLRDPLKWSDIGLATISFGHGIAVNTLQLAAAYRVFAAQGVYKKPTIVKKINYHNHRAPKTTLSQTKRVFSPQTVKHVNKMLEAVVNKEGTGFLAKIDGYRIAGKTGTSQKVNPVTGKYSKDKHVAVFAGFLPVDKPEVIIVVAVDEPVSYHTGGQIAAPVFADIAQATMNYMGTTPSPTATQSALLKIQHVPNQKIRTKIKESILHTKSGTIPSFLGLSGRQIMNHYIDSKLPLNIKIDGSGLVMKQTPLPGTQIKYAKNLHLILSGQ